MAYEYTLVPAHLVEVTLVHTSICWSAGCVDLCRHVFKWGFVFEYAAFWQTTCGKKRKCMRTCQQELALTYLPLFCLPHLCHAEARPFCTVPPLHQCSYCRPSQILSQCYIRMVMLHSKWIWFHYTLTHELSNNFELAEHVSSSSTFASVLLVHNKEQNNLKKKLFSGITEQFVERIWNTETKCVCSTCLQITPEICFGKWKTIWETEW